MGRRLYETMPYWETADQDQALSDAELEWTALWNAVPKVVFSSRPAPSTRKSSSSATA